MIPIIIAIVAVSVALATVVVAVVVVKKNKKQDLRDNDGTVSKNSSPADHALQGEWESENGRWQVRINGWIITIELDGEVLFNSEFSTRLKKSAGETEILLGVKWLRRRSASALRAKALYRNGDSLYFTTIDPDKRRLAFDDMKETLVLKRKGQ